MDPLASLQAQRQVLHAVEEGFLYRRVLLALRQGDADAAAAAVAAGLRVAPDRFRPWVDEVAASASPSVAAELLTVADPSSARASLVRAHNAGAELRYRDGFDAPHLRGVDWPRGNAVLAGVRGEYLVQPDEASMAGAAHDRLRRVADSREMEIDRLDADERVEDVLRAAIEVGIPEPVAIGEGVEAALLALDPFTRPVWPMEVATWEQHHAGVIVGVGLTLMQGPDNSVLVDVPQRGSPAWGADVKQSDRVMAVDGVVVADLQQPRIDAVRQLLAGELDSSVTLTLRRNESVHEATLTRGIWPEETVAGYARADDNTWIPWADEAAGIAFVRIRAFRPSTHQEFDALMAEIQPHAMILDLRGNPGGDVNAAAHITDRFVADGIVANLVGRTLEAPDLAEGEVSWNTALPGNHLEAVDHIVVLVDEGTASAAELVAGGLRERRGAQLVGATTVGKGLSQGLRTDEVSGVAWQVTTGTWTLPSSTPLETPDGPRGLVPDVRIALSAAESFQVSVLQRQREHLLAHRDGSPIVYAGERGRKELPTLPADPQLARAIHLLRARTSTMAR